MGHVVSVEDAGEGIMGVWGMTRMLRGGGVTLRGPAAQKIGFGVTEEVGVWGLYWKGSSYAQARVWEGGGQETGRRGSAVRGIGGGRVCLRELAGKTGV